MRDAVNATVASKILGCKPTLVKARIQQGVWPIGVVIDGKITGKKNDTVEVYLHKLSKYFNIPIEEVMARYEAIRSVTNNRNSDLVRGNTIR